MAKQQNKKKSSYEGLQNKVKSLRTPGIEVWKNQYPSRDYVIELEIPEFTCICPKTGLPDFAVIKITYCPDQWCLELKSFKMYINEYRNVGIFHEHVVNRILDDLVAACKPRFMSVDGEFNLRGGIKTSVWAEYKKGKK